MEVGQVVIWRWFPHGRAEPSEDVIATVLRMGHSRVEIGIPDNWGRTVRKWIKPEYLHPIVVVDSEVIVE
jgi:hypothetical protein